MYCHVEWRYGFWFLYKHGWVSIDTGVALGYGMIENTIGGVDWVGIRYLSTMTVTTTSGGVRAFLAGWRSETLDDR